MVFGIKLVIVAEQKAELPLINLAKSLKSILCRSKRVHENL